MLCSTFRTITTSLQKNLNLKATVSTLYAQPRFYSSKPLNQPQTNPDGTPAKKTKKPAIPKITLISPEENVTVVTLEEAQKLSKRRDLKLVKIVDFDTKTQRPIYKLMTGAQYYEDDLKQREERKKQKDKAAVKGEKLLTMSSNITEHDFQIHMNKIRKWIAKRYEVRVNISGSDVSQVEKLYKEFESTFNKDQGRIVQMRLKGNDCKFQILPPKQENNPSTL